MELFYHLTLSGPFFLIQYVPEKIIKARWFLIEILLFPHTTKEKYSKLTGQYKRRFLSRHPDNNTMSYDLARWWPDWHEIIHNNTITLYFGDRMLFAPILTNYGLISFPFAIKIVIFLDFLLLNIALILLSQISMTQQVLGNYYVYYI